jgi:hypothetical protein
MTYPPVISAFLVARSGSSSSSPEGPIRRGKTRPSLPLLCAIVLALVVVCQIPASAQTLSWVHQFGTPGTDTVAGIAVSPQGLFVFGYLHADDFSAVPKRLLFLRRYDTNGAELWTRTLGGRYSFHWLYDSTQRLHIDSTGLYVIGQLYQWPQGVFVCKYDFNGNQLWLREFDAGGAVVDIFAIGGDSTGVYVAGMTEGALPGQTHSSIYYDAYIRKYDINGHEMWTRQFSWPDSGSWATGVATDSTGVYVVGSGAGQVDSLFLRKYSVGGDEMWTEIFGGVGPSLRVVANSSGIYMLPFIYQIVGGQSFDQHSLRRYDANGTLQWIRPLSAPRQRSSFGMAADDTGIVVAGPAGISNPSVTDIFVAKYDEGGNEIWTTQLGGPGVEMNISVAADSTGLYIAGMTDGTMPGQTNAGGQDAFVAKLDPTVRPACAMDVSGQVAIARSGFRFNASTQRYVQTVSLRNTSSTPVPGPVSLVVDGLSANAVLANRLGVTSCSGRLGSPYAAGNIGSDNVLIPGEVATVILEFNNPSNQAITYATRILAGPGAR